MKDFKFASIFGFRLTTNLVMPRLKEKVRRKGGCSERHFCNVGVGRFRSAHPSDHIRMPIKYHDLLQGDQKVSVQLMFTVQKTRYIRTIPIVCLVYFCFNSVGYVFLLLCVRILIEVFVP
jgi:hypothetical protein